MILILFQIMAPYLYLPIINDSISNLVDLVLQNKLIRHYNGSY